VSGVVESGYNGDLVEQLPQLTRAELWGLEEPGRVWPGADPLVGDAAPALHVLHEPFVPEVAELPDGDEAGEPAEHPGQQGGSVLSRPADAQEPDAIGIDRGWIASPGEHGG
jgi:hypothetical protein